MGKGGGGGGSGKVDYPAYMTTIHNDWLDNTGVDTMTSSITDLMESAVGSSPWAAQVAYDPDTSLALMIAAPENLQDLVTLLSTGTTLDTLISSILDDDRVDTAVTEYTVDLTARYDAEILPALNAGYRDINMVSSSAFVIGRSVLLENMTRQVAKYSADLHMKAFSDDAIKVIGLKLEYQKMASQLIAESNRVKIVAKKEENDSAMVIDHKDAIWDLEVYKYGGNLLASIGGGVSGTGTEPTQLQSAIGGVMTGAAAGAMVGGPPGAVVGGVLGLASSFL